KREATGRAEATTSSAEAHARRVRDGADEEAASIRRSAEQQAAHVRTLARAEREEAATAARQMLERARWEAEEVLAEAMGRHQTLVTADRELRARLEEAAEAVLRTVHQPLPHQLWVPVLPAIDQGDDEQRALGRSPDGETGETDDIEEGETVGRRDEQETEGAA